MNNLHESQRRNNNMKEYNSVILALQKREEHSQRLERLIIGLYVVIAITTAWSSLV